MYSAIVMEGVDEFLNEDEIDLSEMEREVPQGGYGSSRDLKDEFEGNIEAMDRRVDKRGRECLFMTIRVGDTSYVIKYTNSQERFLKMILNRLGFPELEKAIGAKFKFRKHVFGGRGYPRPYPIKQM